MTDPLRPKYPCCLHCKHGGGARLHGADCPWCETEATNA